MNKLNSTFKINPLYEADSYKLGHKEMLAPNTTREAWNWIPRSLKQMHPSIKKIMSSGQQLVWRYVYSNFQEYFFDKKWEDCLIFLEDINRHLGIPFDGKHFHNLHKLGYLPIEVKALPEGVFTEKNIPHMTGINTVEGYAWLGLYLETLVSKLAWQVSTAATIGYQFKKNAIEWVLKTDKKSIEFADFMCHDFHSRGGNPFTSIAVGLGFAMSNKGSDTLNVIPASRYYYDVSENEVPIFSVTASEHSVSCTNLFYYENLLKEGKLNQEIINYYDFDLPSEGSVENPDYLAIAEYLMLRDWLKKFPTGILSYVCDTMNTWKACTHIIPRLKTEILNRDGKLVVRGDSGDPVDIICGKNTDKKYGYYSSSTENLTRMSNGISEPEWKGVIELLWDIFGGTINEQGYKVLDPHIGSIYGDAINLDRQVEIYSRLEQKQFAATNFVCGVGSYSLVYMTRDQAGWAAKGCWFETIQNVPAVGGYPQEDNGFIQEYDDIYKGYNIYKDPITDDGTKKSLKGFQFVYKDEKNEYQVKSEVSEEEYNSEDNELKTIFKNGKFFNQTTLTEIRDKINSTLLKS